MSQSLVKSLIHPVYSTKHRRAWIPEDVQERLWAYQAGIFKEWQSQSLTIVGMEEHLHALFSLSRHEALKLSIIAVFHSKMNCGRCPS